ncbi:MAG TPA: hypothetical protein VGF14_04110, partial [Alphaproteobacteria bacterium]
MLLSCDLFFEKDHTIPSYKKTREDRETLEKYEHAKISIARLEQQMAQNENRLAFLEVCIAAKKQIQGLNSKDRYILWQDIVSMASFFDNDREWFSKFKIRSLSTRNFEQFLERDQITSLFESEKTNAQHYPYFLENSQTDLDRLSKKREIIIQKLDIPVKIRGKMYDINQASVKMDGLLNLATIDRQYTNQTAETKHYLLNSQRAYMHVLDAPVLDAHQIIILMKNMENPLYTTGPRFKDTSISITLDGIEPANPAETKKMIAAKQKSIRKLETDNGNNHVYILLNKELLSESPLIKQTLLTSALMAIYQENEHIIAHSRQDHIFRKYYKTH